MLLKWDQRKAWKAISDTAPVLLGVHWRMVIVYNTPIVYGSLVRWEKALSNPGHNRMIPRLETIGNLMSSKLAEFTDAVLRAETLISKWEADLSANNPDIKLMNSNEGFVILEELATLIFRTQWQRPLADHLEQVHGHSVSHASFSVWKYEGVTRDSLLAALQKISQEAFDRLEDMEATLNAYEAQVDIWKSEFPLKKSAMLTRKPKPSALLRYLPSVELEFAVAA